MSFKMMLSVLRRQSLLPLLVMLQVVAACAILCNMSFLTWQQAAPLVTPSGIDGRDLVIIDQLSPAEGRWSTAQIRAGTEALREVPGVDAVSPAIGLPMDPGFLAIDTLEGPTGVKLGVDCFAGKGLVHILGAKIVAGRDFLPGEYLSNGHHGSSESAGSDRSALGSIIITEALAHRLFGDKPAIGGVLSNPGIKDSAGSRVVGVVSHLMGNQIGRSANGAADDTILIPTIVDDTQWLTYAVRVKAGERTIALRGLRRAVAREFGAKMKVGAQADVETYAARRRDVLANRRAAIGLLLGIVAAVLLVTIAGVMGLTSFWVSRRIKQVGILRALGAQRHDVLAWVLLENAMVTGAGVILGMAVAYGGNAWLMQHYELVRLPWQYLPIGAACMLVVGQLAALGPALRASYVPPIAATRAV